ncbi:hypothetical protein P9112_012517 [Eukaryota sp. TZLM1-RC]
MFRNLSIYLDRRSVTPNRLKILQNLVTKNDGTLCHSPSDSEVTHVITSDTSQLSIPSTANVASHSWISACIKAQSILPTTDFPPEVTSSIFKITEKPPVQLQHHHQASQSPPLTRKRRSSASMETSAVNLNEHITAPLLRMSEIASLRKDVITGGQYRSMANKKAASQIAKLPFKVTNITQLEGIPGIGEKTLDKVNEILTTGVLLRAEQLDGETKIKQQLQTVSGIGPSIAEELIKKGVTGIEDLFKDEVYKLLNHHQKIGLKYFEDFLKRIPRSELEDILHSISVLFSEFNDVFQSVELVGSYRRGHESSGDCDLLVTFFNDLDPNLVAKKIGEFITGLKNQSVLIDDLSVSDRRYLGVVKLPNSIPRRIDIFFANENEHTLQLLGLTGSGHFNRSLRYLARRRGYSLSNKSLAERSTKEQSDEVCKLTRTCLESELVFSSEEEVFKFFNLPYIKPELRNGGVFDALPFVDK